MDLQGISNFYISEEWGEIDSIGSVAHTRGGCF